MGRKALLAVGLSLLLVYVPVAPAASPAIVGQMSAKGAAEVNGVPVPADRTVFAGDRIATRENTAVAVSLSGGDQIFLPQLTTAQVNRTASRVTVSLERGALAVVNRSSEAVVVEANGVRIQPAGHRGGIYEVAVNGNIVQVLARKGTALVEAANRNVEVKEGTTMNATVAPGSPKPQPAGGLSTLAVVSIVVSTAAGIAGLALGVVAATRSNPEDCVAVSPSLTLTCK